MLNLNETWAHRVWPFFADFEHVNGRWNTLLPWCKSIHFRARSRNPVIIMAKLYVTTVNNSFQALPNFCHKELYLRCCIGLELNIVTWSTKFLRGVNGVNINSLMWNVAFFKFVCSIFSKGAKPFDLIKHNIIGKLENLKSQTHSQINGGLIMFLKNRE